MNSDLINTRELSELLGVPESTIYRWRHHGDGPIGFKMGRHIRFRRADVDQWIAAQINKEQHRRDFLKDAS